MLSFLSFVLHSGDIMTIYFIPISWYINELKILLKMFVVFNLALCSSWRIQPNFLHINCRATMSVIINNYFEFVMHRAAFFCAFSNFSFLKYESPKHNIHNLKLVVKCLDTFFFDCFCGCSKGLF